jgi:hypothetical protein
MQPLRGEPGIGVDPGLQIFEMQIDRPGPWQSRTIRRRLQPMRDIFADRRAIDPELPRDRGDLHSLAVHIQDHDEFPKLLYRGCASWRKHAGYSGDARCPGARAGTASKRKWGF